LHVIFLVFLSLYFNFITEVTLLYILLLFKTEHYLALVPFFRGKYTTNIPCEATGECEVLKCEILLMVSGFTNSGQEDRNEPKSEGPTTFRMCFIWISNK